MTKTTGLTTADLLAMPDDGMERWLIKGELREKYPDFEKGTPMTVRNRFHCATTAFISTQLNIWSSTQPKPRGLVCDGEAGVVLGGASESTVGVDVVYISPEVRAAQSNDSTVIEGVPVLAVEVLSPTDTTKLVHEKISEFLNAGVALVWIVDPYQQTVTVYQRTAKPRMYNTDEVITAEPHLPGFRVPVINFFDN